MENDNNKIYSNEKAKNFSDYKMNHVLHPIKNVYRSILWSKVLDESVGV